MLVEIFRVRPGHHPDSRTGSHRDRGPNESRIDESVVVYQCRRAASRTYMVFVGMPSLNSWMTRRLAARDDAGHVGSKSSSARSVTV